jgi:hypothetical protein
MTCTKAEFDKRTAEHQIEILRADGLYRHLRFRKPGTGIDGFDFVTWPGFLAYAGDMGDYLFERSPDMLAFFRGGQGREPPLAYWAEKCVAEDRDRVKEYCPDRAREAIGEWLDDHEATPALRQEVDSEILSQLDDGQDALLRNIGAFEHQGWSFQDFHEVDLTVFTFRFRFCCYALQWGVAQYDQHGRDGL